MRASIYQSVRQDRVRVGIRRKNQTLLTFPSRAVELIAGTNRVEAE